MIKQRKQVKVSLYKLLKIIEIADQFKDFEGSDELLEKVSSMIGHTLLDSEIEDFASWYLSPEADEQGYDKEHYDHAMSILENFKKQYCKN